MSKIIALSFIFTLFACENDVDINTEFEEVTAVFGLLDAGVDTQFVKVTRTFLDDNLSAVQLASDPNNIYYDSLIVELEEEGTANKVQLSRIILPKQDGVFTTEQNEVYFTTFPLSESAIYNLTIQKPDSSLTLGRTEVLEEIRIIKPAIGSNSRRTIPFVNFRGQITPFTFELSTADNVGEFEVEMTFRYIEIINNDSTTKEFLFPLGTITNPDSRSNQAFRVSFASEKLFAEIENTIPADPNAPKRFIPSNAITVEINSADTEYTLYRDVFGPIDGLSQTRAEYTNVTSGIGLFSSRRNQNFDASINDDTYNFIFSMYGQRNNLGQFRNFQFP